MLFTDDMRKVAGSYISAEVAVSEYIVSELGSFASFWAKINCLSILIHTTFTLRLGRHHYYRVKYALLVKHV